LVTNCIVVASRIVIEADCSATVATDLPNGWTAGQHHDFIGTSYFELKSDLIVTIVDAR